MKKIFSKIKTWLKGIFSYYEKYKKYLLMIAEIDAAMKEFDKRTNLSKDVKELMDLIKNIIE